MTISLQDNAIPAANTANIGTLELQNTDKSPVEGPAFAQVISGMWPGSPTNSDSPLMAEADRDNPQGQALADANALSLNPWVMGDVFAVKAMNLGPHMNIITAQTPPPDSQSLEAFARSQGLDEAAVHWLFGAGSSGSSPGANPGTSTQFAGSSATPSMTPTSLSLPQAGTVTASGSLGPEAETAFALGMAQAIWKTSEPSGSPKGLGTVTSTAEADAEGIPLNLLRMPPPAAVWMQRSALTQLQNPTTNPEKAAQPSVSELDLGADWVADLEILSLDSQGSAPNGASTTGTHGSAYANFAARWDAQAPLKTDTSPASASPPPASPNPSETIQNLADKMGHAIGQRILSEMEKGQWHLKLQLRPATLGHIEVEMRMRSGEFDAVFTAPHHLTRDLLQDGMNRLRDTLSQMGMDVASIHVQDGQTGQRGGDSTPGAFGGKTKEDARPAENVAEMPPLQKVKISNDGLDILV